jgi:hypothetical protein
MHAPRCLLVPLFAILAAAPVALAPGEARADWAPLMHRSDIGVDMYLWPTRDVGTAGPVIPFVQFEPTDDLFINLRFPVATWIDPGDDFRAALGNPTFSIWYSDTSGRLTWNVGGRASLPVGSVDSGSWRGSIDAASVAMGLYDVYLWAWDTLPFGGLGGIDWQASRIFALRAGGDVTFYPTLRGRRRFGGAYDTGDFDVVFQGRVDAEFQSNSGAGGGVSLMGWAIPTFRYGDRAQTMIMPYFVYDSQRTFFMRVGGLIALDRPLGPGFDRDRVASLYLQFGGHLD